MNALLATLRNRLAALLPEHPTEDEISEYLAIAGGADEHAHPYNPFPARPTWRGGPNLGHADDLAYRAEQDDQ